MKKQQDKGQSRKGQLLSQYTVFSSSQNILCLLTKHCSFLEIEQIKSMLFSYSNVAMLNLKFTVSFQELDDQKDQQKIKSGIKMYD